ncbi:DUF885 domain-containing protein [Mucilaginibacter sp. L3T2-6]|uniref:DUF885 domain-containing protein n=1 Tax=Mucilaginibacter sp. L3T2-6 TaxID=3062491 RepID=UPI00267503B0|nr:DUF885 domain-containing protein [Mucilaginibacter sp. L3T2-6]MDO3642034.1 DUF885 domain-containing protein [Mucilaginibacter sp. L3T2-6]MDV6214288.1 DUF885 domain-containing protein [Mucilaginibacter sp. L3T2-6]
MMLKTTCLIAPLLFISSFKPQPSFKQFTGNFVKGYSSLKIPAMDMSYVSNLKGIGNAADIKKQTAFFESVKSSLKSFSPKDLTEVQRTDYELIAYETALNLERLALEKQWAANPPKRISDAGIYTVPNGKAWYAYFLKNWLSADVTPDEIYKFGLSEVDRVKDHIEAIRKQSGLTEAEFYKHLNDRSFFINDPADVMKAFEHTKSVIYSNLNNVFNTHKIESLKIEQGANQQLAQTPGYYDRNVFYYNQFGKPYNKRQVDWLFIHEAVPGHHYKSCINAAVKQTDVQRLFYFLGLEEGWGAYVEELGKDLGVYKTPYDELGKWEWDIVRSVRVPMDIGLNYYGWTDEQALAFWKKNIKNQDDIALREIARVKRWPAQCITYKYGAGQIMQWKAQVTKQEGAKFDIRNFHDRILNLGSLPVFMVGERVIK